MQGNWKKKSSEIILSLLLDDLVKQKEKNFNLSTHKHVLLGLIFLFNRKLQINKKIENFFQ